MEQPGDGRWPRSWPGRHLADAVFVVALVVAVPVIRHAQRAQWFAADEWSLVFEKELTDPASMIRLQNGHITTLPAVAYRLLYNLVGLHHYWPYQALAIATHLAVVVLVRLVMVRAGVDRWIATAAAIVLLFLGSGNQNIGTGFQVTLTGAVALGLLMLVVTDHDGPLARRDALGVACGLAAVGCSAIAAPMLVAVGLAAWARRGPRTAAVLVAPPLALFVAWTTLVPTDEPEVERGSASATLRFTRMLWLDGYEALGQSVIVGGVLLAALVAGWALVVGAVRSGAVERDRIVAPAALLVAAVVTTLTIGWARSAPSPWGAPPVSLERYLYLVVAISLPALAVALSELGRRWAPATAIAVVALLLGLPGNVQHLRLSPDNAEVGDEALLLQIADQAVVMHPPDDMKVVIPRGSGRRLTLGDLRRARLAGEVPDPLPHTDEQRQRAFLLLLLAPSIDTRTAGCDAVASGEPFVVDEGDRIVVTGPSPVQARRVVDGAAGDVAHTPLSLTSPYALDVTWGPAEVALTTRPDTRVAHCPAP